jgi:hypothetical protein
VRVTEFDNWHEWWQLIGSKHANDFARVNHQVTIFDGVCSGLMDYCGMISLGIDRSRCQQASYTSSYE